MNPAEEYQRRVVAATDCQTCGVQMGQRCVVKATGRLLPFSQGHMNRFDRYNEQRREQDALLLECPDCGAWTTETPGACRDCGRTLVSVRINVIKEATE